MTSSTRFLAAVAFSIMTLVLATPSYANHSIEHADAQLEAIIDDADATMQAVVDRFVVDAQTATSKQEVALLGTAAKAELRSIKVAASAEVAQIGETDKADKSPSHKANNVINSLHKDYINKLHDARKEELGEPTGEPSVAITLSPSIENSLITEPPQSPLDGGSASMSSRMIDVIGVVVPPRIAAVVLSPLIVLEYIIGVLTSSASALIFPGLLLGAGLVVLSRTGQNRREANA